jgi:hypothetical protein
MDDVKKKVLLELFVSPWTVLPLAGGLSAWMLSWGIGGSDLLNLLGLGGVLGGLGMLASRLIFQVETITQKAFHYASEKQQRDREAALDALDERLRTDNDERTERYLQELRRLYQVFQDQARKGKITGSTRHILANVEQLFQACVRQLEQSYELWRQAEQLSGRARKSLLADRDAIVEEVSTSVQQLARSVEQLHLFQVKHSETELARLRDELDESMRIARRAEERMATLGVEGRDQPNSAQQTTE